jgi:hypothetical protein
MPTEILRLFGFDGPNLYGPQPSVFLQVRSDKDRGRRLRDALKDGGQSVGMVIGYLDVGSEPAADGYTITAQFATPTPQIGVALARYVVAGLNAKEASDDDWDAEGPLWELQKRRRAEELPVPALQISAEAATRGVPALLRSDRQLQLGYGVRSWSLDLAALKTPSAGLTPADIGIGPPPFARAPVAVDIPWERLGPIPIIAIAGGAGRDVAAQLIAAALYAQGQSAALATPADFDATQALLGEPGATFAVVGLTAAGIVQRGLAFERCAYSAVTELPPQLPPDVSDRAELARVLGVPMLVTDAAGAVALNADLPEVVALAEFAPCPVIYISTAAENATVGFHRASGGTALFVRDGAVIAATGPAEQSIASATLAADELPGALAALALLSAMGLTWEQIIPSLADR